jgi:hypothetical protein
MRKGNVPWWEVRKPIVVSFVQSTMIMSMKKSSNIIYPSAHHGHESSAVLNTHLSYTKQTTQMRQNTRGNISTRKQ